MALRLLHTMPRVGNLERSIRFYAAVMGMHMLRTTARPKQNYSPAFLGYGPEHSQAALEL